MRKLFMTDIHGEFTGMMNLLHHVQYQPGVDQLVIGGDMVSRGSQCGQVLKYMYQHFIQYPSTVKVLLGNHEEMLCSYFNGNSKLWLSHSGNHSLSSLKKSFRNKKELQTLMDWLDVLPLVYLDDTYVYTHAGFNPYVPIEQQERKIIWISEADFYSYPKELILKQTKGRPVIHGHTPCEYIYTDGARMNCDLGSNTYVIEDERALALVDLTSDSYHLYKQRTGEILQRKISVLA